MDLKTIAVIGAGSAGREIAYAAARGGYRTVLEDVSPERLVQAIAWIKQTLEEGVSGAKMDAALGDATIALISTAPTVEDAIRDADLVIETVPDEMEMKLELFTIFDKFGKPGAIFASNTSALSIGDMTDVTVCQDRCIGMHFHDAPPSRKLVELIQTPYTSEETVARCREVARRMGREVVLVQESSEPVGARVGTGSNA